MKVEWKHHSVGLATWEKESEMRAKQPQLFKDPFALYCFFFWEGTWFLLVDNVMTQDLIFGKSEILV